MTETIIVKDGEKQPSWWKRHFGRDTYLRMPTVNITINNDANKDPTVEKVEVSSPDEVTSIEEAPPKKALEDYLITKEPFYQPLNGEVGLFETAFKEKLPFMFKGPTGCGKTRFIEHMAYKLGKPLITVSCQEDLSASDLVGRYLLNENGSYWQDGPLAMAVRQGAICYLDEIVEARNDAMVLIHSLTDHRRVLPIDKTGELVRAHDDFMLVVSYNPHYQSALKQMKQSTRQRFLAMDFDYPAPDLETKIVAKESGVDSGRAKKLVDLGQKIRGLKGTSLTEGASTRLLIYAGKLMASGVETTKAIETAMASPLTDEADVYQTITGMAKDYF